MPLNRTPPPASPSGEEFGSKRIVQDKEESTTRQHSSEPDIPSLVSALSGIDRKKRKRDADSNISSLLKDMFGAFSKEQENNFTELKSVISVLKEQNLELKKSVEIMSSKYDDFLNQITALEQQKQEDKKAIAFLEDRVEFLERKSRATGLEIRNVPRQDNETKSNLCTIVSNLGKTINLEIDEKNIKDVYRASTKDSSKPIIVELTSVLLKNKILKNIKSFNKSKKKEEKLNTSHLILPKPVKSAKPVFVSETLTNKTQKIFYMARLFKKTHGYSFCWTSHGVVYLRKDESSPQVRISSETDIDKLRNSV